MVLSELLLRLPYRAAWRVQRWRGRTVPLAFYCGAALDYVVFEPVHRHLPGVAVVAASRRVQRALATMGVTAVRYPVLADTIIMARHALHRFPEPRMRRIGMRHGAFAFKAFIKAARYNAFDTYLATSSHEVELARRHGITSMQAVGFPKLDPAFDGTVPMVPPQEARRVLGLDPDRPLALFSATWDGSGMSAVDRWAGRLAELPDEWQVAVTLHHWVSTPFVTAARRTPGVRFIEDPHLLPWLRAADVVVSDTSSIIAEASALERPIITFRVPPGPRTPPHLAPMLEELSEGITAFEELPAALARALEDPGARAAGRARWNRLLFDRLDGRAGERAAAAISAVARLSSAASRGA